jgi:hypothetical protein
MNQGYTSFRRIREIKRAKERAKKLQLTSRFKQADGRRIWDRTRRETGRSGNFRREKKGAKQVGVLAVGETTGRDRAGAEYGRENEGKGRSWEEREAEQRGRFLYTQRGRGRR